jgi:very-short-patch-repair endonuclease
MRKEMDNVGIEYIPEYRVNNWLIDIYIPSYRIAVECDGSYWHGKGQKDITRDIRKDIFLASKGIEVIRLPEKNILESPSDCAAKILAKIHSITFGLS